MSSSVPLPEAQLVDESNVDSDMPFPERVQLQVIDLEIQDVEDDTVCDITLCDVLKCCIQSILSFIFKPIFCCIELWSCVCEIHPGCALFLVIFLFIALPLIIWGTTTENKHPTYMPSYMPTLTNYTNYTTP